MSKVNLNIHPSWLVALKESFNSKSYDELLLFLEDEYNSETIYPKQELVFEAFNQTHFNNTKVVIIGQDPYHNEGQAHGLSFSVQGQTKTPPSLKNIFKELESDLQTKQPQSGNLTSWCKQGVLMLNATLTVRAHQPGSHQKKGWEEFTDGVIEQLSSQKKDLVFILWGKYAQKKGELIDKSKHHIIASAHPSPFAARKGFFGSKPFSKTNSFLSLKGIEPINWSL